jgi:hypothetical protein
MWCPAVEGSTGRSLQELSEVGHGDSRRESPQNVDVVIGVAGREKAGVDAARRGVEVLIAVPERKQGPATSPSPEILAWRERMQTDDAKRTYRARAALCELSNAHLKCHHGTAQLLVRGTAKVTCVALLAALTSNILAHAAELLA